MKSKKPYHLSIDSNFKNLSTLNFTESLFLKYSDPYKILQDREAILNFNMIFYWSEIEVKSNEILWNYQNLLKLFEISVWPS